MTTAAILCIARNENPFTAEWLEYHIKLGFDRIYFVSTDNDFSKIEEFFKGSKFRLKVDLHYFDDFKPGWQIRCYNLFLPLIKEDWLMVMDIDEYLYLNTYPGIQNFLDSVQDEIGQVQFPWANLMSVSYFHGQTFDIVGESEMYASDHVKSLVRRDGVTGLGVHSHGIGDLKNTRSSGAEMPVRNTHSFFLDNVQYYQKHPFILHFCSRGHFDVINRIVDHHFFNSKNGHTERTRIREFLTAAPHWGNLPTRYLLMKFYRTLPTVEIDITMPELEAKTDVWALLNIFHRNLQIILDFDCPELWASEKNFENQYQLAQKLADLDLPAIGNQDDYIACSTQLEYIDHLRALLPDLQ